MNAKLSRIILLWLCGCGMTVSWAQAQTASEASVASGTVQAIPANNRSVLSPELLIYGEETWVSTATKHLQKLSEAPGSVTIITEQEIKEHGALTLREILLNLTGTELVNDGLFESVRFRGMQTQYNAKILVLQDGRKLNSLDLGDFCDDFGFNLDNIKQIEIIKGPGSSLYGADAFAGVINIITKDGRDISGVSARTSFGNKADDKEFSQCYLLTYGQRAESWDYVVSTSYWRQLGLDLINARTPNNIFEGNYAKLALKYGDEFVFHGGYDKMLESTPGISIKPGPKSNLTQNDFYGDAEYMVPLTSDSKLRFRLEDTYFGDRGIQQSVYDVPTTFINSSGDLPPGTSLVLDLAGHTHGPEYALGGYWTDARSALRVLNNQATVPRGFGGPMSEFLTEVQWDWAWPENNYFLAGGNFTYDQSGQNCYTSSEVSDKNYAAYLQDEYHLWEQIVLLAGLRYDFNTAYGSNLSPRGSVVYSPLPEWRFKALYGTAFRAPMFWERYANDMPMGGFFIGRGNSELKPEKVDQAEASAEYFIGNWAQLKGDYFYWETQDEIQAYSVQSYPYYLYAPDLSQVNSALPAQPGLVAFNQGGIMSISNDNSRIGKGFELEATARPITYMKIQLNYAHFNMYSRKTSVYMFIDQGDEDILNAMVGFNYKGLFFINFYGHMAKTPKTIIDYTNPEIFNSRTIWLNQFDITLGGKIRGVDLALTIFNFMENAVAFDQVKDAYLKGPKILRLTAAYNLAF